MSHTVVRGAPTAAQLYLDQVLDEVLLAKGIKPDAQQKDTITLPQLMFHCLRRNPNAVFMTNGATGEVITNEQLLRRAVSLARALNSAGARGKHVMLLMRNHQHMAVVYFAVFFAGVVPFCMDPNTTAFELSHFLELIEPSYVFYDREHHKVLNESLNGLNLEPTVFVVDEPQHLMEFVGGASDDVQSYQVPEVSPDDTVILLPTSGSTGLPKAAELTHRGTVAQLPTIWAKYTKFPTPVESAMILTTIQWATFTMAITTCIAYDIPILISPIVNTAQSVTKLLEKYRPTWTFFAPAFANTLVQIIRPDQLTSLETLILLGAPPSPELIKALKEKLPETTHLCDGYGSTESQGFIALPDRDTPINSNGRVVNCLNYKIVDEYGQELGLDQSGELWLKGSCMIKQYYKSDKLNESLTEDGWYRTGDTFYVDQNERIYFKVRNKFSFKFRGCQVAPEEVERVISSVLGVRESVVCASEGGPAAAVVVQPGAHVTKEDVHKTVNVSLSEHKRLHGGVMFVPVLPHTHSGKLDHADRKSVV